MNRQSSTTIHRIEITTVMSAVERIEELQRRAIAQEKLLIAQEKRLKEARDHVQNFKQLARIHFQQSPELLTEMEAELAEIETREQNRLARIARTEAI